MRPMYVIHYTLFRGGSVLNRYRFFETKKKLSNFLMVYPWIRQNCIIFENIDFIDKEMGDKNE